LNASGRDRRNTVQTSTIVAIIVVLVVITLAVWAFLYTRSQRLRTRFGPEYQREVEQRGSRWRAETALATRERRVARLPIRPLTRGERDRFAAAWYDVQARFVDDPGGAVTAADGLLTEVMAARGYPTRGTDFEQRAADLSVDHGEFVDNYRAADNIAHGHQAGNATTEDLRRALVFYRALFDDLLEVEETKDETTMARGA
jgi:hypothetical protein